MLALLMLQKAMGCRLHDPCNIILMQKQLEKRFDNWDWTIIPEGTDFFRVISIDCIIIVTTTWHIKHLWAVVQV